MAGRMKRFTGLLNRTKSNTSNNDAVLQDDPAPDSPEASIGRAVRLFCESGSMSNGGEEVLHLPVIVEAAESSPSAAARAAAQIRQFLAREWASKPHVQYNAVMLIRILSDNPGPTFTKNFDEKFVSTVKELLRKCKDASTQQILRETLDNLEANKSYQEGMEGLIAMWRKEKGSGASLSFAATGNRGVQQQGAGPLYAPQNEYMYAHPTNALNQQQQGRSGSARNTLPSPQELASRIEEARNTAKILLQLIQSTPSEEVLENELIREFNERCQSAQKSMQGYINAQNPAPDDDTMLTLIETNEQLSLASSRFQRSVLSARRAMGQQGASPQPPQQQNGVPNGTANGNSAFAAPPGPPPQQQQSAFAQRPLSQEHSAFAAPGSQEEFEAPSGPPPGALNRFNSRETPTQKQYETEQPSNPFEDPVEHDERSAPIVALSNNHGTSATHPHRQQSSQSFSIDAGTHDKRDTADLNDAYRTSSIGSSTSPTISPSSPKPPNSPPRPAQTGVTPSYLGRQDAAAAGLTMSGASPSPPQIGAAEIDGHSEVGRKER